MLKTAAANPERTCPDCSYRTSSPLASVCPVCNVPLVLQERTWGAVRRPVRTQSALHAEGQASSPSEVMVHDLSVFGARLAHREPLRPGRWYALALPRTDRPEPLALPVRILWSSVRRFDPGRDPGMIYHSGVEFRNLPPAVDRDLVAFLGGPGGTRPGPLQGTVAPLPE